MSVQLEMFAEEISLQALSNMKTQIDGFRRRAFAEISELRKDVEFLSLQLQILIEEKDQGLNNERNLVAVINK